MSPSLAVKSYDKITLNAGVVLDLPGFEGSGGLIRDISQYHNNGTITGATWTMLGSGLWVLSFDGTDDRIDLSSHIANFSALTDGMIEMWVNPTTGAIRYSFSFSDASMATVYRDCVLAITDVSNSTRNWLEVIVGLTASRAIDAHTAINTLMPGVWSHIVVRMDTTDATQKLRCYINGVEKTLTFDNGTAASTEWFSAVSNEDIMYFGRYTYNTTSNVWFKGQKALQRIYSAPSVTLAANHFNSERTLFGV